MTAEGGDAPYLLDTNVLISLAWPGAVADQILARFPLITTGTAPLISTVTEAEVRSLTARNGWGEDEQTRLESLLGRFRRVSIEQPGILDAYVSIDIFSHQRGIEMGKNDLWIAATASVTTATLLTTDRDFDHLDPDYLTRVWIDPVSRGQHVVGLVPGEP